MPKSERSAGFVLFQIDPASHLRRYLLLDYGRYWDFPKGHLEPGESDLTAAVRELKEETDITRFTQIAGFAREIKYFYYANRKPVNKSVIFFLAQTDETRIKLSDEHVDGRYFSFDDAMKTIKYANSRELLREAELFLQMPD